MNREQFESRSFEDSWVWYFSKGRLYAMPIDTRFHLPEDATSIEVRKN